MYAQQQWRECSSSKFENDHSIVLRLAAGHGVSNTPNNPSSFVLAQNLWPANFHFRILHPLFHSHFVNGSAFYKYLKNSFLKKPFRLEETITKRSQHFWQEEQIHCSLYVDYRFSSSSSMYFSWIAAVLQRDSTRLWTVVKSSWHILTHKVDLTLDPVRARSTRGNGAERKCEECSLGPILLNSLVLYISNFILLCMLCQRATSLILYLWTNLKNSKSVPTAEDISWLKFPLLSSRSPKRYPLAWSTAFITSNMLSLDYKK